MKFLERMIKAYGEENKNMEIAREDIFLISSVKDILKFYGNEDNHEAPIYDEYGEYSGSWVDKDGGTKARVILEEL